MYIMRPSGCRLWKRIWRGRVKNWGETTLNEWNHGLYSVRLRNFTFFMTSTVNLSHHVEFTLGRLKKVPKRNDDANSVRHIKKTKLTGPQSHYRRPIVSSVWTGLKWHPSHERGTYVKSHWLRPRVWVNVCTKSGQIPWRYWWESLFTRMVRYQ